MRTEEAVCTIKGGLPVVVDFIVERADPSVGDPGGIVVEDFRWLSGGSLSKDALKGVNMDDVEEQIAMHLDMEKAYGNY